jgi:hypothetical protein
MLQYKIAYGEFYVKDNVLWQYEIHLLRFCVADKVLKNM